MIAGTRTAYGHIVLDEKGTAWIDGGQHQGGGAHRRGQGSRLEPEGAGISASSFDPRQVHSALAYYWDHQDEIEQDLQRREALAEEIRREAGQHPLIEKLRSRGQI
jgi:hypothetical protein